MAAEARYPTRRRSSRQNSQLQQASIDERSSNSSSSPRATRTRSNVSQGEDAKSTPPISQPPVEIRQSDQINADQTFTTQLSSPNGNGTNQSQYKEEAQPEPINEAIVEYVREGKKDVLWYATPPINVAPSSKPMHSTDYLYWKQQQRQKQQKS